jgi:uncharacterized repeat protein (TIGR03803 family)
MRGICIGLCAGAIGCALVLPSVAAAAANSKESVVHSFGGSGDGAYPAGGPIDVKGTLYGTTVYGGTESAGTVYSLNPKTGKDTPIYSFCSQENCIDGEYPGGQLVDVSGTLYSTTSEGGTYGDGTVFSLDPSTGAEKVLWSFGSGTDGKSPGGVIETNGTLYGTTTSGGANGDGAVFAVDISTGTEAVLYSFCNQENCADGESPESVVIDEKGTLYGTTKYGGANGDGVVYALDIGTGAENAVYSFCGQQDCHDGQYPVAGVIDVKGELYGVTVAGGSVGGGTVFELDPATGKEKVLYSFCSQKGCADGEAAYTGIIDVKGTIYGNTSAGGADGDGTAYSLDPATGVETVLHSFCGETDCADGKYPWAAMIDEKKKLYGITYEGGANCQSSGGCGTLYAIKSP